MGGDFILCISCIEKHTSLGSHRDVLKINPFNGITGKYQMMPPNGKNPLMLKYGDFNIRGRPGDFGSMKKTETPSKRPRVAR